MQNYTSNQELLTNPLRDHELQRLLYSKKNDLDIMHERECCFLKSGKTFNSIKLLEGTGNTYEERQQVRAIYMDAMGFANFKGVH